MKITDINRDTCKAIRKILESELASPLADAGLRVMVGNATFDPGAKVTFKVEVSLAGVDIRAREWDKACFLFDLEESDYMMPFDYRGKRYFLCGFKPRATKFPILAECEDGGTYKFPPSIVDQAKKQNQVT